LASVAVATRSCPDAVRPLMDVSPPPAPASDPQANWPVVASQVSLPVMALQVVRPAPAKLLLTKRVDEVAFVVDAFVTERLVVVALVARRLPMYPPFA